MKADRCDSVFASAALIDLPILGTLVLVFALHQITRVRHENEMRQRYNQNPDGPMRQKVLSISYGVAAVLALYASIMPGLNKGYMAAKPPNEPVDKWVSWLSGTAHAAFYAALTVSLLAAALETNSAPIMWIFGVACVLIVSIKCVYFRRNQSLCTLPIE